MIAIMMTHYVILYGDFKSDVVRNSLLQKMSYADTGHIVKFILKFILITTIMERSNIIRIFTRYLNLVTRLYQG